MKPAVVYDGSMRDNGTGCLFREAIRRDLGISEMRHFEPHGKLPEFDCYIYVDDGRDDITWECPHPNAFWAVDTHLGYEYRLRKAAQFDFVFTAQQDAAEQFRRDGIKNVEWLPLACSPLAHPNYAELMQHEARQALQGRYGFHKQHDVGFVGFINEGSGPNSNNRLDYLEFILREFPNCWITTDAFFEEMAARYVRSRVGFNVSIKNDLNMRFFEIPSTGTCMVTNRDVLGWQDLGFQEGVHFLGYQGYDELRDKIKWALSHPSEREEIAKAGHAFVRQGHTYADRAKVIMAKFGG